MRCPCWWNRGSSPFLCKNLAQETSPPLMYTCARFFVMNPHGHSFTPAADHPRIRGEKALAFMACGLRRGSPPHTRGKAAIPCIEVPCHGITPAYAGKRSSKIPTQVSYRVHPRIRGEKLRSCYVRQSVYGSPPHTRGKVFRRCACFKLDGFTPAYAGKRRRWTPSRTQPRVHPRIRGEKQRICYRLLKRRGSPPHTRGKAAGAFGNEAGKRFTPAYAGKSLQH